MHQLERVRRALDDNRYLSQWGEDATEEHLRELNAAAEEVHFHLGNPRCRKTMREMLEEVRRAQRRTKVRLATLARSTPESGTQ